MKIIAKSILIGVLSLLLSSNLYSQNAESFSVSSEVILSDEKLPFWFHSNKFGLINPESNQVITSGSYSNRYSSKNFTIDFQSSLLARVSNDADLFFHTLAADLQFRNWLFTAGKKEWSGIPWRHELSVGSMVWSSNASTIPKIGIELIDYVPVPLTSEFLSFRGYLYHGWFEDDRYVKDVYLHEKAFYIKFFKPDFFAQFHAGVIHNAQWAGNSPDYGILPGTIEDFVKVFFAQSAGIDSLAFENINTLGNSLGAYDYSLFLTFDRFDLTLNRQWYIESKPGVTYRSLYDGIYGMQWEFKRSQLIQEFIYEHINTTQQDSRYELNEIRGADKYYWNGIYRDGWSYKNRIIGLPLVLIDNQNGQIQFTNSILLAHHFGLSGFIPFKQSTPINYELKFTYSRNYGFTTNCPNEICAQGLPNPYRTPRIDQYYSYVNLSYPINSEFVFESSLGADFGDLSDSFGLRIALIYKPSRN